MRSSNGGLHAQNEFYVDNHRAPKYSQGCRRTEQVTAEKGWGYPHGNGTQKKDPTRGGYKETKHFEDGIKLGMLRGWFIWRDSGMI